MLRACLPAALLVRVVPVVVLLPGLSTAGPRRGRHLVSGSRCLAPRGAAPSRPAPSATARCVRRPPGLCPRQERLGPDPHPLFRRRRARARLAGRPVLGRRRRLLPRSPSSDRDEQRGVRDADQCGSSADRAEIDTRGPHRHVLQRVRVGVGERPGRSQLLRRAGAGRVLLRRDDREARASIATASATAASPPASSRRRAGR